MDGFTSAEIRNIINDIRTSSILDEDTKRKYFIEKHSEFRIKFPKLFDAALDTSFPMHFLDFMLQHRDQLYQQNLDKKSVESADKIVYDKLRETFVTPVIGSESQS